MRRGEPYVLLGVVLVAGGTAFTIVAWFVMQVVPLVALGASCVLLGVVSLVLADSLPKVPVEASSIFFQTGLENLSALLEEIGLTSPALYLPSRAVGGDALALIMPHDSLARVRLQQMSPARLIVSCGPGADDMGILVRTPGTAVMRLLKIHPGAALGELEDAIAEVVIRHLDLASGVRVYPEGKRLVVDVVSPFMDHGGLWTCRSLGSPLASIIATVIAEGLDRPVRVHAENWSDRRAMIVLEPFGEIE